MRPNQGNGSRCAWARRRAYPTPGLAGQPLPEPLGPASQQELQQEGGSASQRVHPSMGRGNGESSPTSPIPKGQHPHLHS